MVKTEIEQLEKALNALVHHPQLIRRDYWTSQIESVLERTGLSPQDRKRLQALRDLLGFLTGECTAISP
ncbi:hypothetical protein [Trinickia violacea]|nr:hypothetical protein [Trinickia violacea]